MIDLLEEHAANAGHHEELLRALAALEADVLRSARAGDVRAVRAAEADMAGDPAAAFAFDASGAATLIAGGRRHGAGTSSPCASPICAPAPLRAPVAAGRSVWR